MLIVHSGNFARLDVLPEDGPMGTETCRSYMKFWHFNVCEYVLEFFI